MSQAERPSCLKLTADATNFARNRHCPSERHRRTFERNKKRAEADRLQPAVPRDFLGSTAYFLKPFPY